MNNRKYNKILLINCTLDRISREKIRAAVSSPNLGLLGIASMLLMHGYEVDMIDFFVEDYTKQAFFKKIIEEKPDVIGFSVYTRTTPFLFKMLEKLNQVGYEGKVVVGGPHPSFQTEEMLENSRIDYVISGEGEITFVKLLESLNSCGEYCIEAIDGVSYNRNGNIIKKIKNNKIKYLDALPLQSIGLIDPNKYSAPFTLITSRGCPGDCIYCASRALSGSVYRMRSAESIICEMIYLRKQLKHNKVTILDDTFTADTKRFDRFYKLMTNSQIAFKYRIESRGDVLTTQLLHKLKQTNCQVIHVGVESGCQEILDKIGKKVNLQRTIDLLLYGQHIGIHMVASFIIGHYCDTESTIYETLQLMKRLQSEGVETSVAMCTPFPGTPIYNYSERLGIKIHAKSWQEYDFGNVIMSTKNLSQTQLRQLLFEAIEICS